jgi:hypothetical protein
MRALGVNAKSGFLFLAVVETTDDAESLGRPVEVCSKRLQPSPNLPAPEMMRDLYNRIRQEIRAAEPDCVAMLETRMYSGWVYSEAFKRISMITTLQLVCDELVVPYTDVKTERVGKFVGLPANKLDQVRPADFGFTDKPPTYWTTGRGQAFAVAATAAAGLR